MTSDLTSPTQFNADCATFEERLMAYRERDLDAPQAAWMVRHQQECARCEALMRDLDALVDDAAALEPMSPSRDLWPDVLARLEAPVVPISSRPTLVTPLSAAPIRRAVSVRIFAIAATMLVAVSSAVTWQVARSGRAASADSTAAANLLAARPDPTSDTFRPVANVEAGVVYEQEIAALRTIVNERFAELDSTTVAVLRANLMIIDKAIADSRAALEEDPRSSVLSSSLDHALETKLALMRRVALL